ncbi:MAG: hypothetical protein V3R25_08220 [Nitrosomonadaceae bacterium]
MNANELAKFAERLLFATTTLKHAPAYKILTNQNNPCPAKTHDTT